MLASLDHLVVTAGTLEEGVAFVETTLGTRMVQGGKHEVMATHNALLSLGGRQYLEVIALDPEASAPDFDRWFDLDYTDPTPRLATWVAQTPRLDATSRTAGYTPGPVWRLERNELHWRIAFPPNGELIEHGLLPYLVEWGARSPHPSDRLPDAHCTLQRLVATHPEPGLIHEALQPIGLDRVLEVERGEEIMLQALIDTPNGVCVLS